MSADLPGSVSSSSKKKDNYIFLESSALQNEKPDMFLIDSKRLGISKLVLVLSPN